MLLGIYCIPRTSSRVTICQFFSYRINLNLHCLAMISSLVSVILRQANFNNVILREANHNSVILRQANVINVILSEANLISVILRQAS